jgi:hypothetical protein
MKGKAGHATRQESKNRIIASEHTGESGHVEKLHVRLFNGLGVGINDIPTSIHEIVELLLERRDLDVCVFEIVLKLL